MSLPLAAFSASWAFVIAAWAEPLASLMPGLGLLVHLVDADLVLLDALLGLLHLGGDGVHLLVDLADLALHVRLLGAARERRHSPRRTARSRFSLDDLLDEAAGGGISDPGAVERTHDGGT